MISLFSLGRVVLVVQVLSHSLHCEAIPSPIYTCGIIGNGMADVEQLVGLPSRPCDGENATATTPNSVNSSSIQTTRRRDRVRGRKGPPPSILEDKELNKACEALPNNYKFEIHKVFYPFFTSIYLEGV